MYYIAGLKWVENVKSHTELLEATVIIKRYLLSKNTHGQKCVTNLIYLGEYNIAYIETHFKNITTDSAVLAGNCILAVSYRHHTFALDTGINKTSTLCF